MDLRALVPFAAVALAACASTSAKPAEDEVAREVRARSGHEVGFARADREVERALDRLIAQPLTADAAVQIALLHSPALRFKLESLAIGQADLVQAGLLKNPVLSIGRTAWDGEHIDPNLFATVEQDFVDLVTLPLRKRVAAAELEATKLGVADQVLELAAEVRAAFHTAQAAGQIAALRRLVEEAARASAEVAGHQHAAGNLSDLGLASEQSVAAQAKVDRARARATRPPAASSSPSA